MLYLDTANAEFTFEVQVALPILNKLILYAGLETPGVQDARDVFVDILPGSPNHLAVNGHFFAVPGVDIRQLKKKVASRIKEIVANQAGISIHKLNVELEPGTSPDTSPDHIETNLSPSQSSDPAHETSPFFTQHSPPNSSNGHVEARDAGLIRKAERSITEALQKAELNATQGPVFQDVHVRIQASSNPLSVAITLATRFGTSVPAATGLIHKITTPLFNKHFNNPISVSLRFKDLLFFDNQELKQVSS